MVICLFLFMVFSTRSISFRGSIGDMSGGSGIFTSLTRSASGQISGWWLSICPSSICTLFTSTKSIALVEFKRVVGGTIICGNIKRLGISGTPRWLGETKA